MKLEASLDEFELLQRRRLSGMDRELVVTALAALKEYLLEHVGLEETSELEDWNLFEFLLDYYPSQEEPDEGPALFLLDTASALSRWLVERGERGTALFLAAADRLREDLPRVFRALALLKDHTHPEDLGMSVDVGEEEEGAPLGTLSSGVERVARPGEVDYNRAEEDHFTIVATAQASVTLHSDALEALGQGTLGPVQMPAAAAALLRPADILHAEVAPGRNGWELIGAFGIRPGGYL